jgi:hypothetical protein
MTVIFILYILVYSGRFVLYTSNDWMILNCELKMTSKEKTMLYFKVLFLPFILGTEENQWKLIRIVGIMPEVWTGNVSTARHTCSHLNEVARCGLHWFQSCFRPFCVAEAVTCRFQVTFLISVFSRKVQQVGARLLLAEQVIENTFTSWWKTSGRCSHFQILFAPYMLRVVTSLGNVLLS